MDQAAAKTALSTLLSDTLQQVSDSRLTAAITTAWNDSYVVTPVFDTTIVFVAGTYSYPIPAALTTVDAIYIQRSSDSFPGEIGAGLWEVIAGNIIFQEKASYRIPDGYTLEIRGKYKLKVTDSIPASNVAMQNYVIALAGWTVLQYMGFTKVLSFLNNDTSVAELVAFKNDMKQDMLKYRQQLQSSYVDG